MTEQIDGVFVEEGEVELSVLAPSPVFFSPNGNCPRLPSLLTSSVAPSHHFCYIYCSAEPARLTGLKWKSFHTTGTAGEMERKGWGQEGVTGSKNSPVEGGGPQVIYV